MPKKQKVYSLIGGITNQLMYEATKTVKFLRFLVISSLILVLSNGVRAQENTTAQEGLGELSEAERYVLARVVNGQIAFVDSEFKIKENRVLHANFLVRLLGGELEGVAIHRQGVRIYGAVIKERLDVRNTAIPHQVQLVNCTFHNTLNMEGAQFSSDLSLSSSKLSLGIFTDMKVSGDASFKVTVFNKEGRFKNAEIDGNLDAAHVKFQRGAKADFSGMKVDQSASFLSAKFGGPANFESAKINGEFNALQVRFTNDQASANFKDMKVGGRAIIESALFGGVVNLTGAEINGDFVANGAQFFHKEEPAQFSSMRVGDSAFFQSAVFDGPVSFEGAEITINFVVDEAEFRSTSATTNFNSLKVGGTARFQNAVFNGPVDFSDAQVARDFWAYRSEFEAGVKFDRMKVGQTALFRGAQFLGSGWINFVDVEVGGDLHARGIKFTNEKGAGFNNIKVGGNALFESATFAGRVNFVRAEISGQFLANRAQFNNTEMEANFSEMKVGGRASFQKAVFAGPVDLNGAEIRSRFQADGAQFNYQQERVNFERLQVGYIASFTDAIFAGGVNFVAAEIGSNFVADNAKFLHKDQDAVFSSMRVGNNVLLRNVEFSGPVDFRDAEVGRRLVADEARFTHPEAVANFDGVIIEGPASFKATQLEGGLSVAKAQLLDLLIGELREKEPNKVRIKGLDLSQTRIRRELQIQNVNTKRIVGSFLQVEGPATLENLTIGQEAKLKHARFLNLQLDSVTWPDGTEDTDNRDVVELEGMTYKHISAEGGDNAWRAVILKWIDHSAYSAQPYTELEASFQAGGYPERADEVYVHLRKRQRGQLGWIGIAGDWLIEKLVRYGRSPELAFYWSALVIFIGVLMFRRTRDVQLQDSIDEGKRYNPLWYSLDLFLPFIDLQAAGVWMPRQDSWLRRHYARVHTILGWVLIPIGLAAITGIIK